MKFYNPFIPHLVKLNEHYAVRKLTSLGWQFFDLETEYWWFYKYAYKYCATTDPQLAQATLNRSKGWKPL